MPDLYVVTASGLNLRSEPVVKPSTRIVTLPEGAVVAKTGTASDADWWRVSVELDGVTFEGFVRRQYLAATHAPPQPAGAAAPVPEVHLVPKSTIRRDRSQGRAYPLHCGLLFHLMAMAGKDGMALPLGVMTERKLSLLTSQSPARSIGHMLNRGMILLALVSTLPITAEPPKEAWALTVEERIALRTSPELARERVRESEREQAREVKRLQLKDAVVSKAGTIADAFDGKTHPELFLPTQVFHGLIEGALVGDERTSEVYRRMKTPQLSRHGLPLDFWDRLRSISAAFAADLDALHLLHGLPQQSGPARVHAEEELNLKHTDLCRDRADALAAARAEFGRERFDRFLYESLAIHMFHVADRLPDPEVLRWHEGGCR